MKSLKYYLQKAEKEEFAIPQFNFSDFTQLKAIINKCGQMRSPVILGTSEGESKFFGFQEAVAIRDVLRKKHNLPIFFNLDHGKSFEYLKKAIDAGYDMVHFDGSKLPLNENIKISKQVSKYASASWWRSVLVEGEVGKLGTDASKIYTEELKINEADLTNPDEAKRYVDETKVDLLTVGIGNFHGMQSLGENPNLKIDVLKDIKEALRQAYGKTKNIFLVLHGGSGTPENDIKEAIKSGIVKININTELRQAFTEGLKEAILKGEIVPYKYLPEAQKEVEKIVEAKINLFGSANRV